MKLPRILPALLVASMAIVAACGGDDTDGASMPGDESGSEPEGGTGEGADGLPALFELSACDMIPAEDLDAVGFEPEPIDTLGEAGDWMGNGCWWRGGGTDRTAMVGFVLSDLESNYFKEVTTDEETDVDGRPARRITGFDDMEAVDADPACGVRIEVESGVILMVEVSVRFTEGYGTDDEERLTEACAILDTLVPTVSAQVPGSEGDGEGDGEGASSDEDEGADDGEAGATVPARRQSSPTSCCAPRW